jgi:hypothetical protein
MVAQGPVAKVVTVANIVIDRPAATWAAFVALSILLNWPYLTVGFAADDIILINLMAEDPLPYPRWRGIWSLFEIPSFTTMWWKDPAVEGGFFRPVPSLIIEGSVRLLGHVAWPLHLLSLVLHGGVAAGLALFVRRLGRSPALALGAGLLFVACEDHSMGVGWIATITDMLCVQFVVLSLLFHLAWHRRRETRALVASVACMALALGSKESAAVAPVALVLLSVLAPGGEIGEKLGRGRFRDGLETVRASRHAWLPPLVVLATYLVLYRVLELGIMRNLLYVDPFGQTGEYLARVVVGMPIFWLSTLTPAPGDLAIFEPELALPMAVAGTLAFALWLVALWPLRRDRLVVWAMSLYIVVLMPQLGTDASARGLYLPMVFAAIVLARLALAIGPLARRLAVNAAPKPLSTRLMGWWALVGVLGVGLVLSIAYPYMFVPSLRSTERDTLTALPLVATSNADHVVALTSPGMMSSFYTRDILTYHTGEPVDVRVLAAGHGVWSVERMDERSFSIRIDRTGWLSNMFARVVRIEPEPRLGRVYETDLFRATVLELTDDGTDVLEVRFEFERSLDDPAYLFVAWTGKAYERVDVAELPVGETVELCDNSNVWAAMS